MLAVTLFLAWIVAVVAVCWLAPGRVLAEPGDLGKAQPSVTAVGLRGATPSPGSASTYRGLTAAQWAGRFRHRTRQLQQARRALHKATMVPVYGMDPLERAFMCIHGYEGSWTDNGAPHWGGLQMDMGFQSTYGGWALRAFGTANHWPISVQLATAIRAKVSGRGFYPWPNTARHCGLI